MNYNMLLDMGVDPDEHDDPPTCPQCGSTPKAMPYMVRVGPADEDFEETAYPACSNSECPYFEYDIEDIPAPVEDDAE